MDSTPDPMPATHVSESGTAVSAEDLAALTRRVWELERQLAALRSAWPAAAMPTPLPEAPQARPLQPAIPLTRPPVSAPVLRAAISAQPRPPARSLEDRLGGQIFNRIAILALLIGVASFLKLAIDHGWIGPVARILIGLAAGVALIVWSERFRRTGSLTFSHSLKAVGSGVLYLSLWAAYQINHLLPAPVALGAMILVTAWNGFMAWQQDAELLAAYALAGALGTPLLLSTGGNHETFLFTYIAAIDLATLLLVRLKPWPRILLSALLGTISFYFGWYARFYSFAPGPDAPPRAETIAFLLLFWSIFAATSLRGVLRWLEPAMAADTSWNRSPILLSVLVPLLNAGLLSIALAALLERTGHHGLLAWLMAALAAVYLLLTRLQRNAVSAAVHLALAVVFLTIAIPLKASGHSLTIAWLVEGVALLWASTRTAVEETTPRPGFSAAGVLRLLSAGGLTLGFGALVLDRLSFSSEASTASFFNEDLGSSLVATAVFSAVAWLMARRSRPGPDIAFVALCVLDGTAFLLCAPELGVVSSSAAHTPFANPQFATALVGLGVLTLSAWLAMRLPAAEERSLFQRLTAITIILLNLAAILSVEREISAFWTRSAANLQRSLAISGFLMLYGAALLTIGFVRRAGFIRWQALALIVFTIAKVFLYDVAGLSEGYRVASFLGLGVLLMGVSFAYQKDWLSLREPAAGGERTEA